MSNKMIIHAISAVLALGINNARAGENKTGRLMQNSANIPGMEKCFGIAKKGNNDCGNESHNCSGEAKMDGDKNEWLYVPKGLCERIVGGNTKTPNKR